MKQKICTNCGYLGKPKKLARGSILIEIILWSFFIIPGIIYSIWREVSKYDVCPQCGKDSMIPIDSPVGEKMFKELNTKLDGLDFLNITNKELRK